MAPCIVCMLPPGNGVTIQPIWTWRKVAHFIAQSVPHLNFDKWRRLGYSFSFKERSLDPAGIARGIGKHCQLVLYF